MIKYSILFLFSLALAARGEIVDKTIIEDWSRPVAEEVFGKKVLHPAKIYVFIDESGKRTIVTETEWENKKI